MIDDKNRGILDSDGDRVNPATDGVSQSIRDNDVIDSPAHATPVSASNVESSHTLTSGKKHLYIYNYGANIVFWGATGVTVNNGQELLPKAGFWFKNCASGFKVYFICNGADTANIRITEFASG